MKYYVLSFIMSDQIGHYLIGNKGRAIIPISLYRQEELDAPAVGSVWVQWKSI